MNDVGLILLASTCLGLASALWLGLFGVVALSAALSTVLLAQRGLDRVGIASAAASLGAMQVSYVFGGWLLEIVRRRLGGTPGNRRDEGRP